MITQRIIVPGGIDRVTSPPISRTRFDKMSAGQAIPLIPQLTPEAGNIGSVLRCECTWDGRHDTISLLPEIVEVLGLMMKTEY